MNNKFIQIILSLALSLSLFMAGATVVFAQNNVTDSPSVPCANNNVDPECQKGTSTTPTDVGGAKSYQLPTETLRNVLNQNASGLNNFDGRFHELAAVDPGADTITSIIFTVIDFMKYLLGTMAVFYAIYQGVRLVTAGRKIDEVSPKVVTTLKYMIYGFIVIMVADELIINVFYGEYGECVASQSNAVECAKAGNVLIKGIYDFILSVMATLAIFSIALAGFRMVTAAGNEDTVSTSKKRIAISIVGLIVAGLGEFVVRKIIFPDSGSEGIDYTAAQNLVISFTNYIASFIGVGAFIMLFYGGYLYAASFGNDDQVGKAKKIITSALIGIFIAVAAFGLVRTISSFQARTDTLNLPAQIPGIPQNP